MNNITTYIIEKLRLGKDTKVNTSSTDPDSWQVGDIICAYGICIEFYKIMRRTASRFDLIKYDTKILSGALNAFEYTAIPNKNSISRSSSKLIVTKRGYNIDGDKYSYVHLWDGEPVKCRGNIY